MFLTEPCDLKGFRIFCNISYVLAKNALDHKYHRFIKLVYPKPKKVKKKRYFRDTKSSGSTIGWQENVD